MSQCDALFVLGMAVGLALARLISIFYKSRNP